MAAKRLIPTQVEMGLAELAGHGLAPALAGTGMRRHLNFERQVDEFHLAWKAFFEPRILQDIAISEVDLDRTPRFTWREEDPVVVRNGVISGLLQVTIPGLALACVGIWRLRRYTVV